MGGVKFRLVNRASMCVVPLEKQLSHEIRRVRWSTGRIDPT